MNLGALFSDDRTYRYTLHRIWNPSCKLLLFVLLNPSTADETKDDPTIKRCVVRALNAGYGGVEIVNIFAWRSTDPQNLYRVHDPEGCPRNDVEIKRACFRASLVVCGWGLHGALRDRGAHVLDLIRSTGTIPHALKLNADGTPQHPLYLSYKLIPFPIQPQMPAGETVANTLT